MSYEKQTWNKYDDLKTEEENIANGAVVTDNRMNHIEEGIESNDKANSSQAQSMNKHIADTANPHKVTALQVGLDKLDNVQQAAKTDFDSHVNNKSNPHAVTASQVGAYSKSETDTKFATGQSLTDSLTDLSNKAILNKGNLASGTDLNNVTDTGFYRIGGLIGGADILNVPSELQNFNFFAFLTVIGSLQELTVYSPKRDITWTYSRSVSGSTPIWSSWSKTVMADDSGKVTVKDLKVSGSLDLPTSTTSFPFGYGTTATAERVGNQITLSIASSNTAAIPSGTTMNEKIPEGYRPKKAYSIDFITSGTTYCFYNIGTNGSIQYGGNSIPINSSIRGVRVYYTNDAFPAS